VTESPSSRLRRRAWGSRLILAVGLGTLLPAALGASDAATAPLGVVASVVPIPASTDRTLVLVLDLPGSETVLGEGPGVPAGELHIVIRDDAGTVLASTAEPFAFLVAGIHVYTAYRLGAGSFTADATVVDEQGVVRARWSESFAARTSVATWASAPLLTAGRPGWKSYRTTEGGRTDVPYPFVDSGIAFLPVARQVVAPSSALELRVLVESPEREFPFLQAVWAASDGGISEASAELLNVQSLAVPRLFLLRVRVGVPPREDDYGLRLAFRRADGTAGALSPAGVHVLVASAPAREEPSTIVIEAPAESSPVSGSIEEAIVAAANLLVEGDSDAAANTLVAAERGTISGGKPRALGRQVADLRRLEARAVDRLIDREPAAGFPLACLILRTHRELVAGRDTLLLLSVAGLLRDVLHHLVAATGPASKPFAADALSLVRPAAALELDPRHHLALLRLAVGDPRLPLEERALEPLHRVLAAYPEDEHARLVLGVVELQQGDSESAKRELTAVASGSGPDWMREVAYGELAEQLYRGGDRAGAEATLREGIANLAAPQLYLQLGAYLDSWNRTQEAISIVNRMPVERAAERETGRHRMTHGARDESDAVMARLTERARSEIEALRRALAAESAAGHRP